MDADRFDALSRSLTSIGTRRRDLVATLGGVLGILQMKTPPEESP
jgi:hypothetical protein